MNPFTHVLNSVLQLKIDSQGSGNRNSWLFCLLRTGEALHAESPVSSDLPPVDQVLNRLKMLGLADTFAFAEISQILGGNR